MTDIVRQALKAADDDCSRAGDGLARLAPPLQTRGPEYLRTIP